MKKTSKILALVLTVILCMSMLAISALAQTAEQDGLEITLSTDKASYAHGEQIVISLEAKNTSENAFNNVVLKIGTLDGFTIASGSTEKTLTTLAAGASDSVNVAFQIPAATTPDPTPDTGDNAIIFVIVAMMAAGAVIALFCYGRRTRCMALALVMVFGIAAMGMPASAATEAYSAIVSTTVEVNGEVVTLTASAAWEVEIVEDPVYDGPIINSEINSDQFDMSGISADEPVLKSNGKINSFAVFGGDASQYYVASATVKITDPDAGDTWSRVGISHYNGTNSYYGFQVSPGPDFNARKVVTMVITDGNVQWGTITDRSQNWWQNNQGALDYSNLKLTTVRCGNVYYAFLNDQLWYVEHGVEGFDNVDTLPVLNVGSCAAEFTNMSVQYGKNSVDSFLAAADNAMFYAADEKTTLGADGTIQFTGAADQSCVLNAKDHAAKSIGTAAVLPAGQEGVIEFDLTIDYFGSRDGLPALAVTLNRYDSDAAEARSLVIGQYKAGWTGWNSNGNLNDGIGSGGEGYMLDGEETRLEEGQTYHVKFIRVMGEGGQDTRMIITDMDGNVLLDHQHGWADGYKGRVVVRFLCRDLDCTISNLTIG